MKNKKLRPVRFVIQRSKLGKKKKKLCSVRFFHLQADVDLAVKAAGEAF